MVRTRFIGPILALFALAYALAILVHVRQSPHDFGPVTLVSALAGMAILLGMTAPIPLIVLLLGRRRPAVRMAGFALWAVLCIALGLWAAVASI